MKIIQRINCNWWFSRRFKRHPSIVFICRWLMQRNANYRALNASFPCRRSCCLLFYAVNHHLLPPPLLIRQMNSKLCNIVSYERYACLFIDFNQHLTIEQTKKWFNWTHSVEVITRKIVLWLKIIKWIMIITVIPITITQNCAYLSQFQPKL